MSKTLTMIGESSTSVTRKIPKNWKLATVGSCLEFITDYRGYTPPYVDEGIPVISAENVGDGRIRSITKHVTQKVYQKTTTRGFPEPNDVIFTTEAPVGEIALLPSDRVYRLTRRVIALRPKFHLLRKRFLYWYLLRLNTVEAWRTLYHGSTVPRILKPDILSYPIFLPPVEEQDTIVQILDTLNQTIAHTSTLIAKLKQMKAGLLHDLLTRGLDENGKLRDAIEHPEKFKDSPLGQIPKAWEVHPLGKFTHSSAFGPRFSSEEYDDNGNVATLRTTDMDEEGNLDLSTMPLAKLNLDTFRLHLLEPGDLLVSRSGTCGITAVFPGYELPVLPGAFLIRFRLNQGLLANFVQTYFNSKIGRKRILDEAEGGVQKNLRGSTLLRLLLPIPAESEQKAILQFLDVHETRIRSEEAYLEKLKEQKKGLMHDLLTGTIRTI